MNAAALKKAIARLAGTRVLVVGDPCLDENVAGAAGEVAKEAPVIVLEAQRRVGAPGQAANVAANAAALGAKTLLVGVVGEDEAASRLKELLRAAGVTAQLVAEPRVTTFKTKFVSDEAQRHPQHLFHVYWEERRPPAPQSRRELGDIVAGWLPKVDAVVVSDYGNGTIFPQLIPKLRAGAANIPVVVNAREALRRFRGFSVLVANRAEVSRAAGNSCGERDVGSYAAWAREALGVRNLVVTLGREGMCVADEKGHAFTIPSAAREVIDVTGAGDTVTAAVTVALGAGLDLLTAVRIANGAAAAAVGKEGTTAPSLAAVKTYLWG